MQKINLELKKHNVKLGQECPYYEPNVTEDSLFYFQDKIVGFYLKNLPERTKQLLELANFELLSDRVPKSEMSRMTGDGKDEKTGKFQYKNVVLQCSTIIGSIPPKPHMKRPYPSISSIHQKPTAKNFIKAMTLLAKEGEGLIKKYMPEQYELQKQILSKTDEKWRFSDLFTSSISNYNISANYHQDVRNLKNTVNLIFTKRKNSSGGALNVPDYGITAEQSDCSLLVYPAWQNIHGVTKIIPIDKEKEYYRNSLIFYPLSSFEKLS